MWSVVYFSYDVIDIIKTEDLGLAQVTNNKKHTNKAEDLLDAIKYANNV